MATLEERVTALEAIVRDNEFSGRERYNDVRRDIADLGGLTADHFWASTIRWTAWSSG